MKISSVLRSIAIMAAVLLLFACSAVPSTPPDSVTLHFIDSAGAPIANARVGRGGPRGEEYYAEVGYTDNNGYVLFKDAVQGNYDFSASKRTETYYADFFPITESDFGTVVQITAVLKTASPKP